MKSIPSPKNSDSETLLEWPEAIRNFQGIPDMTPFESYRAWLERNSDALTEHGKLIAETGLAGEEFDRI